MAQRKKKHSNTKASSEKCFWLHHGPIASNMRSLFRALRDETDDGQFKYHVGKGRSDYAEWVRDVLGDSECANQLMKIKTRKTALLKLKENLKKYH